MYFIYESISIWNYFFAVLHQPDLEALIGIYNFPLRLDEFECLLKIDLELFNKEGDHHWCASGHSGLAVDEDIPFFDVLVDKIEGLVEEIGQFFLRAVLHANPEMVLNFLVLYYFLDLHPLVVGLIDNRNYAGDEETFEKMRFEYGKLAQKQVPLLQQPLTVEANDMVGELLRVFLCPE